MKYYKVLGKDQKCCNGGVGKWIPGEWMPEIKGKIVPCENGYHLCRRKDVVNWLDKEIWLAEGRGQKVVAGDKVVFREARIIKKLNWNERIARLFACDCAEHVLHFFEDKHPDDDRPRKCIDISRKFAVGKATKKELDAAWAAAWDAAWAATRDAAWDAERHWQTKQLFKYLNGEKR